MEEQVKQYLTYGSDFDSALMEVDFKSSFDFFTEVITEISESKGWTIPVDDPEKLGNKIALMHSELSEALEGLREGNPKSDHISEFSAIEEEFVDTLLRMMHFAKRMNLRLPEAMFAKLRFNATRPHKHGGKKF